MHIGIIGGGFTGCLLAVQLLRQSKTPLAVTLIERGDEIGRGLAYGTRDPGHFLNVRVANMSALPDDPQHFHAWLTAEGDNVHASAFVPRMRYSDYIKDLFQKTVAQRAGTVTVSLVTGTATAIHAGPQPRVDLADGRQLSFDRLALCTGNLPSAEPRGITEAARNSGRYINDPWRPGALAGIEPRHSVLIIGSGLTTADILQSLSRQGHTTMVTIVSRHGLQPRPHRAAKPYKMTKPAGGLMQMFRTVRAEVRAAKAQGHDWRDVIDALRPWTRELWQGLSLPERARFLRHIRPYWEVYRHRVATPTEEGLETFRTQADGNGFEVRSGHLLSIDWKETHLEVVMRPRGRSDTMPLAMKWVINCTGPQGDYAKADNPLVRSAIAAGVIRPDALKLGLDVTEEGAVIGRDGRPSPNIVAVGPPTRGAFWEITAVPDIRAECARMAEMLSRNQ